MGDAPMSGWRAIVIGVLDNAYLLAGISQGGTDDPDLRIQVNINESLSTLERRSNGYSRHVLADPYNVRLE